MSRFFHGGMSDSDTSSEEEEELYSEEESEEEEAEESGEEDSEEEEESEEESDSDDDDKPNRFRFGAGAADSDDSDDEGRRVVKSAKDKRIEEIESSIKLIENAQKINDWVSISAGTFFGSLFWMAGLTFHGDDACFLCLAICGAG